MENSSPIEEQASMESVQSGELITRPPEGIPKSGRVWKKRQTFRSSTTKRQGVLKHLSSDFEKKKLLQVRTKQIKEYERELKEQTRLKKVNERLRREEKQRRRLENEYKTVVTQEVTHFCFLFFFFKNNLLRMVFLDKSK